MFKFQFREEIRRKSREVVILETIRHRYSTMYMSQCIFDWVRRDGDVGAHLHCQYHNTDQYLNTTATLREFFSVEIEEEHNEGIYSYAKKGNLSILV